MDIDGSGGKGIRAVVLDVVGDEDVWAGAGAGAGGWCATCAMLGVLAGASSKGRVG